MAYPSWPSDARSGEPGSLYVAYPVRGRVEVCMTQGRSFIKRFQRELNAWAASPTRAAGPEDGAWGEGTQRLLSDALAAVARTIDQPSVVDLANAPTLAAGTPRADFAELANLVRQQLASRMIGPASLRAAWWVAYLRASPISPLAIVVPNGAIMPTYGAVPDDDRDVGGGDPTCYDPERDPVPAFITRDAVDAAQHGAATGQPSGSGLSGPVKLALAAVAAWFLLRKKKRGKRG